VPDSILVTTTRDGIITPIPRAGALKLLTQ
jgi:hypothetical protein